MIYNIKSLVVLLAAATAITACSSSDDEIVNNQPEQTGAKTYKISVQASKNASNASTRGIYEEFDNNRYYLHAYWKEGEIVEVYQGDKWVGRLYSAYSQYTGGWQVPTKLEGTVSGIDFDQDLTFYYHAKGTPDYTTGQDGTLEKLESTYDICEPVSFSYGDDTGHYEIIDNRLIILHNTSIYFDTYKQAFVRFGFTNNVTELKVLVDGKTYTITSGTAKQVFYVAIPQFSGKTVVLQTKNGETSYRDVTEDNITFVNGNCYDITVNLQL